MSFCVCLCAPKNMLCMIQTTDLTLNNKCFSAKNCNLIRNITKLSQIWISGNSVLSSLSLQIYKSTWSLPFTGKSGTLKVTQAVYRD